MPVQKPAIVDAKAVDLWTAYGISEERRVELSVAMTKLAYPARSVVDLVDAIADLCATQAEFTYCVHTNAIWLYLKGLVKV